MLQPSLPLQTKPWIQFCGAKGCPEIFNTRKVKVIFFFKFENEWRIKNFGKLQISKNCDFIADSNSEYEVDKEADDYISALYEVRVLTIAMQREARGKSIG
jgi:hypothetical protein